MYLISCVPSPYSLNVFVETCDNLFRHWCKTLSWVGFCVDCPGCFRFLGLLYWSFRWHSRFSLAGSVFGDDSRHFPFSWKSSRNSSGKAWTFDIHVLSRRCSMETEVPSLNFASHFHRIHSTSSSLCLWQTISMTIWKITISIAYESVFRSALPSICICKI